MKNSYKILAIETSCDETACAIVENGVVEIASVISSSADLHQKTGGIVPEVAARKQVESIVPVISECLRVAGVFSQQSLTTGQVPATLGKSGIDAIAVTYGPGLIGSLLVGVAAAKTLAMVWDVPLIPVNHLIGHIYGNFVGSLVADKIEFPAVVLVVSGGHTDLVLMREHGDFKYLGGTLDDAAGEAFDKVARLLGLSKYLGGTELSALAATCKNNTLAGVLPRPMLGPGYASKHKYDFSFSGLKTAVMRLLHNIHDLPVSVVACEFEEAIVDVLVEKTISAAKEYKVKSLLLGGGVSANKQLRARLHNRVEELNLGNLTTRLMLYVPPFNMCGDNAAYIASAAFFNNKPVSIGKVVANPSLGILD